MTFFSLHLVAQWNKVTVNKIAFKIKNAGINVNGSFGKANIQINVDEKNPSNSTFLGVVEASSIKTGINLRDNHLKDKEEFFNIASYPTLTMKSTKVVLKSAGVYTVTWILTMKNVARQFTSDVTTKESGNVLLLSTSFTINRNDWNIGGNSMTMGDQVTIQLNSSVTK
jgi:polyisoprenoid-binding protein YceI